MRNSVIAKGTENIIHPIGLLFHALPTVIRHNSPRNTRPPATIHPLRRIAFTPCSTLYIRIRLSCCYAAPTTGKKIRLRRFSG